jgi:hypothetical protein
VRDIKQKFGLPVMKALPVETAADLAALPGYAAIDRGRIVGYAFFVYEGSKGVIGDLFVADGGRLSRYSRPCSRARITASPRDSAPSLR